MEIGFGCTVTTGDELLSRAILHQCFVFMIIQTLSKGNKIKVLLLDSFFNKKHSSFNKIEQY